MPLRVLTTRGCRLVPRRGAPGPWCAGRRHGRGATLRFVRAVVTTGRELEAQPVAGAGAGAKATHLSPGASEQRAHAACAGGRTPRAERWPGTRLHRRSSGPGDHGACARCGIPVPRQRILESTDRAHASGGRPSDHGACGRARKPGEVRGRTTALPEGTGDHGACAQGRIPVTWQRILESTNWARASGERQGVHGGRAVRGLASLCGGTRA